MKHSITKIAIVLALLLTFAMLGTVCASAAESSGVPTVEFVNRPYATTAELGLPLEEIRAYFSKELEVKYENGQYMIEDIGAASAQIYNTSDYQRSNLTLTDGYWTIEMTEEEYAVDHWVEFIGENECWLAAYLNGKTSGRALYRADDNLYAVGVYLNDDLVETYYPIFDVGYMDAYEFGLLTEHAGQYWYKRDSDHYGDFFKVVYGANKTVLHVTVWHSVDGAYYHYIPDSGWYSFSIVDPEYAVSTPSGYENATLSDFTDLVPCLIDCAHETPLSTGCEDPILCAVCAQEIQAAIGHDIVKDEAVPATCTQTGLTEGQHCSRCDEATVAQQETPALGHSHSDEWTRDETHHWRECVCGDKADHAEHSFGEWTVTKEATETEVGEKTRTCECGAEEIETVPMLEPKGLSGGAIAGIVAGSTVTAGAGGFSIFWFVIKKKKWSDLFRK